MDQWMPAPPVAQVPRLGHFSLKQKKEENKQVPRLELVMEVFDFLVATLRSHEAAAGVGLAVQYPAE